MTYTTFPQHGQTANPSGNKEPGDFAPVGFSFRRPDGTERPMERLPATRAEAIRYALDNGPEPGRYQFVCWIDDPDFGLNDFTEMSVDAYPNGQVGITKIHASAGFTAETDDIATYVLGKAAVRPVRAVLSAIGSHTDHHRDYESNRVSLSFEDENGSAVLEFLLEPLGWLDLGGEPESHAMPSYYCGLPSVSSVVQFADIALRSLGIIQVQIRFNAFNDSLERRFG